MRRRMCIRVLLPGGCRDFPTGYCCNSRQ